MSFSMKVSPENTYLERMTYMASIEKRRNRNGELISYKITVYSGSDSTGEPIRRRMTWKPDFGMTEKQADTVE